MNKHKDHIILCEPQCHGFEHAAFNAALLATVGAAFPDVDIVFICEESHRREIEKVFDLTHTRTPRVKWRDAVVPAPSLRGLRRLPAERGLVQSVLEAVRSTHAHALLFCSATEITVLALQQNLRKHPAPCAVSVVLHGVLRSLEEARWRKPWRWGFSLRQALRISHSPQLHYIALGESIRGRAVGVEPSLCSCLQAMDMPRLWNPHVTEARADDGVRFGFFGSTAKGFSHFYQMASEAKRQNWNAEFSLIGFLNGRDMERGYDETIVRGLSRAPLGQQEYSRRAAAIDYAVWPANPAHYGLTASASFLDALDFGKPIIFLANPYLDYYFEKMGDIGYRCETLVEMQHTIESLAREFPAARYETQCAAITTGRAIFDPAAVAPSLRKIMEGTTP